MPTATKPVSRLAQLLDRRTYELQGRKSQAEIAAEAGWEQANIISTFKKGVAKIPIDRLEGLAKAIEVDPSEVFLLGLEQYFDMDSIKRMAPGLFLNLSQEEADMIEFIRKAAGGSVPKLNNELKRQLREVFQ